MGADLSAAPPRRLPGAAQGFWAARSQGSLAGLRATFEVAYPSGTSPTLGVVMPSGRSNSQGWSATPSNELTSSSPRAVATSWFVAAARVVEHTDEARELARHRS